MTLIQKFTAGMLMLAMTVAVMFAVSGQPISAYVCETSTGDLVASGSPCPVGQDTAKAQVCDSQVRLGDDSCLSINSDDAEGTIVGIARTVINVLSLIIGVVSVIVIIFSGFRFITSGGESSNVQGARNGIIYAVVGLVVVVFAQAIVAFILNRL